MLGTGFSLKIAKITSQREKPIGPNRKNQFSQNTKIANPQKFGATRYLKNRLNALELMSGPICQLARINSHLAIYKSFFGSHLVFKRNHQGDVLSSPPFLILLLGYIFSQQSALLHALLFVIINIYSVYSILVFGFQIIQKKGKLYGLTLNFNVSIVLKLILTVKFQLVLRNTSSSIFR